MTSDSRRSSKPVVPEHVVHAIEEHLTRREARRDEIAGRARHLRRLAQSAMTHLHDERPTGEEIGRVRAETRELADWILREGRGDEGLVHDAFQEAAEAMLLDELVGERALSGPTELGVDPETYVAGLADLVGEVRRVILRHLSKGELPQAERYLEIMDELYRTLMHFETPRGIVAMKPKQDTARALLERTRGDVTMARMLARAHLPSSVKTEAP